MEPKLNYNLLALSFFGEGLRRLPTLISLSGEILGYLL